MSLHPLVQAAARGELPPWARLGSKRRSHVARVAELLDDWAAKRDVDDETRRRWQAAAWLHDALKEAPGDELRALLDGDLAELPEPVLHGPAVAARLRREGVDDEELLTAVAYHSLGHPELAETGTMLYAADFLEPERRVRRKWRARLRARMPHDADQVLKEIVRARIEYLLEEGRGIRPETVGFWNQMAGGEGWAGASEV